MIPGDPTLHRKPPKPVVVATALLGLFVHGACFASPTVIVTIDVESTEGLPLPGQMNAMCLGGIPCGVNRIVAMLEARQLQATFYLNVYEHAAWGLDTLQSIAAGLEAGGHDVALHTHPQWAYDPDRPYMYSYSLEDQVRIVADGVALLEEWTGLPVVSHRAGAYSANRDTITALARNRIHLDSSLFLGHPHSRLNGLGLPANFPSSIGEVAEIPVTVYERVQGPPLLASVLPPVRAIGKFDVDAIESPGEASAAMAGGIAARLPYIVLFLHSYSFIEPAVTAGGSHRADEKSILVFEALLDAVSANRLAVVTTRQAAAAPPAPGGSASDVIPRIRVTVPAHKYAVRWWRSAPGSARLALTVSALAGLLVLLILLATLAWRRGVTRRRPAR